MERRTKFVIMMALAVLVLAALVVQADPSTVAEQLSEADLTILLAVVGLYLVNVATKVLRWWVLLYREGESPPLSKVALYFLIGLAINNATPGRVSGEPVRAYLVKTGTDYPMGRGMASIFIEKTIDTVVTLTFAVLGLVLLIDVLNPKATNDLMLSAGIVALFMGTLIVFIAFPGIPRRIAAWFFARMRGRGESERAERWEATIDGFLGSFERGTKEIGRSPVKTMAATGLTAVIWFNEALRLWLVFVALGFDPGPSFELMMVATSMASFAALLIPLGAGSSTAIAAICTVAGIEGTLSTTSGLVFVMTSIWISIPLGAAAMALSGIKAGDVLSGDQAQDG